MENERNDCGVGVDGHKSINGGVEFFDICMDLLNYEGGYHSYSNFESPINDDTENDFIDSVFVLNGYSRLDMFKDTDYRIMNFVDHLIMRTVNQLFQRTHIPI